MQQRDEPMTTITSPSRETNIKHSSQPSIDMSRVAAIILGGGQGSRLAPLTITRCKPAICFGGKYRLIDIPMSNSINSGCLKLFIVTQFLSSSLHQHIYRTYRLGTFSSGFIELLPAEQKPANNNAWFQGTADAVRQNLEYFIETPVDYFLILSGDQLYNLNFQHMISFAQETDADLVVAALPVNEADAKRMGLLKLNEDRSITEFHEKPQERALLDRMCMPEFTIKQLGDNFDRNRKYLGSMGIYLFKRQALLDLLQCDPREDFGKHLIPTKVSQGKVAAYLFDGYWEDIGTIESFYKANIALTGPNPPFNCYDEKNPIFAYQNNLPAPKISSTRLNHSIVCDGSIIEADEVKKSILGPRTVVKTGTIIRNSYIMGNDFYSPPIASDRIPENLTIGENCIIDHAIIDKHVHIGNGVQLKNKNKLTHYNSEHLYVRDGVIIVSRGTNLPDGFIF